MSSPPKAKTETKAGHLPAVKAGGMRIVQKHQSEVPEKKDDKDSKEYETESPPKMPVVVSGVVTKFCVLIILMLFQCWNDMGGDKDFTPAAAQVAHTKPVPAVQKLPSAHHFNQHIHQPRK